MHYHFVWLHAQILPIVRDWYFAKIRAMLFQAAPQFALCFGQLGQNNADKFQAALLRQISNFVQYCPAPTPPIPYRQQVA